MTIVQHDGDKYLEDGLVVPVGVDLAELAGDPVVLPHEQGVEHRQDLGTMALWSNRGTGFK